MNTTCLGVYAEITAAGVDVTYRELVTAALRIKQATGERVVVFAAGSQVADYEEDLAAEGIDEIILIELPGVSYLQTDVLALALERLLRDVALNTVLVPATRTARNVFARVAMKMHIGMTADCTSVVAEKAILDYKIKQIKSSVGDALMVECVIKGEQGIITVKPGIYEKVPLGKLPNIRKMEFKAPASLLTVNSVGGSNGEQTLQSSEIIVCAGRGAMEGDNFQLLARYARQIGAVLSGSRPMVDNGWVPFECQIGQSGTVVRPRVCLIFGVSGAIQFTEGIKGNPLVIAINKDPQAAIFSFADYGIVADMHDVLEQLLK